LPYLKQNSRFNKSRASPAKASHGCCWTSAASCRPARSPSKRGTLSVRRFHRRSRGLSDARRAHQRRHDSALSDRTVSLARREGHCSDDQPIRRPALVNGLIPPGRVARACTLTRIHSIISQFFLIR
jgi:hypothetical protein